MQKLSAEQSKQASAVLGRLDRIAANVQANHEKWGMSFEAAKGLVNDLDRVADEIEVFSFGTDSFACRQAEVLQKDADEGYMATFTNPMKPIQTDGDEPYMSAYADDQSSAVRKGKGGDGRPLAP
jgi:hypothetical protein